MNTVGLARRGAAACVDLLCVGALIALGFWVGAFERSLFRPPPGWFYSEWWLQAWVENSAVFITPVIVWCVLGVAWITAWELITGRSPGARLTGIELVDRDRFAPRRRQLVARAGGLILQVVTLGLGWLWGFVSPTRRTVADLLAGLFMVRRS